jgi:hypothetical protein
VARTGRHSQPARRWSSAPSPLVILAGLLVVVVAIAGGLYLRGRHSGGGDPLAPVSGRTTLTGSLGQEAHTFIQLDTGGHALELVSARATLDGTGMQADVHLVHLVGGAPIGASTGPLGPGYEIRTMAGTTIRSKAPTNLPDWLDLQLVGTGPGVHCVTGVDVTYRDESGRTRTTRLAAQVCLSIPA